MNTTRFAQHSPEQHKAATRSHWSATPCGSNYSTRAAWTREYFDEVEKHRYGTHPWILEAIRSFGLEGLDALEIGFGMGTDHLQLARQGARLSGIDLTPMNATITARRLAMYGYRSRLTTSDADRLPFGDASFDFVYSFGVIHHSLDTEKIAYEIHRVLRPGGRCYVTVYHRNSLFFWWSVYLNSFILKGGWKRRTLNQQLSLIEHPNTSKDLVVRLYRRREFEALFARFSKRKSFVRHLLPMDIYLVSRLYKHPDRPTRFLDRVAAVAGWYVVVEASK